MSTRFNRAYLLVPVVYIGVILGLLFLQFSGGERLTRTVGPLSLRATRNATTEAGEATVRAIDIQFNGLSFEFNAESGLIVETSQEILDVPVFGFEQTTDGFLVEFVGGFNVLFAVAEDPAPEVEFTMTLPTSTATIGEVELDPDRIREVSIPFSFVGTAAPDTSSRASFVTVAAGGSEFFFTAPHDALIDPANEKVVLTPQAAGRSIRYVEAVAGNPSAVVAWFAGGDHDIDPADFEAQRQAFVDGAYRGWTDGRFNASDLTWRNAAGGASFSEAVLTAYLAEAWRKNDYERAYAEMRRAGDLHPEELGLLSSPFLGNLIEVASGIAEQDAETVSLIRSDLAEGRTTVFRRPDLFLFATDRGDADLFDELVSFASDVDLRSVDVTTAVGMLGNYVLSEHPLEVSRQATARFASLVEDMLLGNIVQTDDGFFLQSAPGRIDVALSATAGAAIAALGEIQNDPTMISIGRNLVVSVFGIADSYSVLPASLVVRGSSVEAGPGFVNPEDLYALLADNPAYPRQVSLASAGAPGTWAWTVADLEPARISETEWRLTLRYPRLRTHFLLVAGVPEFERLELFGQTWRDAPDFEIYSKGRHYDPDSDVLMVKYYDDSVQRDMVIYF